MHDLITRCFITQADAVYLASSMLTSINHIISGEKGSGKTMLIKALANRGLCKILTLDQAKEIISKGTEASEVFVNRMKKRSKVVIDEVATREDCDEVLWLIDNHWSFILTMPFTGNFAFIFTDFYTGIELESVVAKLREMSYVQIRLGKDEAGVTKVLKIT